ncbi:hypothetical protein [Phaeobacter sp. HF9A]|uniref:hypothetical protein n=1 Tax=Phaeobacter sp. HF9A TaxID=2721561 RepID=UPI00142FB4ED|nr:hypothetical protein [Phaeobacter sp. HF9A]NIZ15080.1 hypothetical protein [Phaeobacter sp. HF9A]
MAQKKVVTKDVLKIVDLVRDKPKLKHLEIPKYRADVSIEVTASGAVPSTAMDRLKDAANDVMIEYETIIREEAVKLDAKIDALMQQPSKENQREVERMVADATLSINNALKNAEPAAQVAIEKRRKLEAQKLSLLKEARVKTVIKWSLGAIKIGGSIAKLVATSGAEVTSYKTIVTEVVKLGLDLKQQLKNEEALRKDLRAGLAAFLKLRETSIQQAIERQELGDLGNGLDLKKPKTAISSLMTKLKAASDEITKGRDAKTIGGAILKFAVAKVESQLKDVEAARVAYREHTTKTMTKTDKLGEKADKLAKAMRSAKTLKDGVKAGAKCMEVKRAAREMNEKLAKREAFLLEIQAVMAGNGLEIDDLTTLQKIKALDKLTIMSEAKGVLDAIKDVKELVDNIVEAAS